MISFEKIDQAKLEHVIAELLNRIHLFKLKPFDGKTSSSPDLWQKDGRVVICEIKHSLPSNLLDSKEFDSLLRIIDLQINTLGANVFILVVLSDIPDILKRQLEEYFRKYLPVQFILHEYRYINSKLAQYPDLLKIFSEEDGITNKNASEGVFENYKNLILFGLKNKYFIKSDLKILLSNPFKYESKNTEQANFIEGLSVINGQFLKLGKAEQENVFFFINQFLKNLITSTSEIKRKDDIPNVSSDSDVEKAFVDSKRGYYLAGSIWDKIEQATRFYEDSIWEDAREDASTETVEGVNVGDVIFLKSSYAANGISYLRIKGVGMVIDNPGTGTDLHVEWKIQDTEVDIEGLGNYRRTFAKVMPNDLDEILNSIGKREIFTAGLLLPPQNDTSNETTDELPDDKPHNKESKSGPFQKYFSSSDFTIRDGFEPVLGVKSIAKEIANLIRNLKTNDVGKMIGIFGNWGRGKTFLVEQIWKELIGSKVNSEQFIRVNFHAWKYQDTSASWAYMYEAFAKKYFEKRPNSKSWWLQRKLQDLRKRFKLNRFRHGSWPLVRFILTIILIVIGGFVAAKVASETIFKAFWLFLTTIGIADGFRQVGKYFDEYKMKGKASEVFSKYFNKPTFKDLLGVQSEIQGELRHLLECWLPLENGEPTKRILLFVDDIDRCSEERIVQLIDALRVMLEDEEISKRVIVIAAIDERVLKRAIKWKYKALLGADRKLDIIGEWESTTLSITSEYMDKLFLSSIKLGTLTSNERIEIYKEFSKGKVAFGVNLTTAINKDDATIIQPTPPSIQPTAPIIQATEYRPLFSNPIINLITGNQQLKVKVEEKEKIKTSFELSFDENEFLIQLIRDFTDATPRQIRIFYYRYMLARNLLSVALSDAEHSIIFSTNARNQLLANLLMHYTSRHSNNELMIDRKALLRKDSPENLTAYKLIEGKDAILIEEVMDVLEIVVAY